MEYRLVELAVAIDAELRGDPARVIRGLGGLEHARPDQITFLASPAYRRHLATTNAGAVVLAPGVADSCVVDCLIVDDPYRAFAALSRLFAAPPGTEPGVHPSAVVAADARIHESASIGAHCSIEAGAEIGERTVVSAGCRVGAGSRIGSACLLWANVVLYHGVRLGNRVTVHAGAVLGADGFGFAPGPQGWEKIAQLGGVDIGDDVEIGAGTTIDRGALEDTVIEQGVKIDNQVQIAHNARIGAHTAIAGCAGIAGSVRIGSRCRIGGGAGLVGHITVVDGVTITPMSLVTRSIEEPGTYTSGTVLQESRRWKRSALRFDELDDMNRRLRRLERLSMRTDPGEEQTEDPAGC